LYDLESRTFFMSRDVVFMETFFPFKDSVNTEQDHLSTNNHFAFDELVPTPYIAPICKAVPPDGVGKQYAKHFIVVQEV